MNIISVLAKQCRKPSGLLGKCIGMMMNLEHNAIRHWGLQQTAIDSRSIILDIGCGGGKTVKTLAQHAPDGKVYGIDYSHDMIHLSKRVNRSFINKGKVEIVHGTVSSLPFPDNFFDIITAFETTFFWPNLIEDLKEVQRALKRGGTLLIVNEHYKTGTSEEQISEWIQLTGIQLYTPDEYRNLLEQTGYSRITVATLPKKNWISVTAKGQQTT